MAEEDSSCSDPILRSISKGCCAVRLSQKSAGAKKSSGMSDARCRVDAGFYDRVAKVDRRGHAVERYLKLAECAGATVGESLRCPVPSGDPLPRFDDVSAVRSSSPFARGGGKSLSNAVIEEFCRALSRRRAW